MLNIKLIKRLLEVGVSNNKAEKYKYKKIVFLRHVVLILSLTNFCVRMKIILKQTNKQQAIRKNYSKVTFDWPYSRIEILTRNKL